MGHVGVSRGVAFDKCHEILKVLVDTWSNINAIPFRGDPGDSLGECEDIEFTVLGDDGDEVRNVNSIDDVVKYVWPLLLATTAAFEEVPDANLFRMIKDAHDHGVPDVHMPHPDEVIPTNVASRLRIGRNRLSGLVSRRDAWKSLPNTTKVHRMRRAIDRRFDG